MIAFAVGVFVGIVAVIAWAALVSGPREGE